MGFSENIKNRVLVESARHCCVCHRYRGLKIEVHHIVRESEGGDDTYDNAIALCFDCHTDAGHYNPNHPRGTKFSTSELRKAKEEWIATVKRNGILPSTEPDALHFRYYICTSYVHLTEILNGDYSVFPFENPMVVRNRVFESLAQVVAVHPYPYRHAAVWGGSFSSVEQYVEMYPTATVPSRNENSLSYYMVTRIPDIEELQLISSRDGLLQLMLETDMPPEEIALVVGCNGECGGVVLQEEFVLRDLWCVFLAMTNLSTDPLTLQLADGEVVNTIGFASLIPQTGVATGIRFPRTPVLPGETVLLPLGLVIPPIHPKQVGVISETNQYLTKDRAVYHQRTQPRDLTEYLTYGYNVAVHTIHYESAGSTIKRQTHEFDMSNTYSISRFLECGSCPHVFFAGIKMWYHGEVLATHESRPGTDLIVVPDGATLMLIAEIEDETTDIDSVLVNSQDVAADVHLTRNDFLSFPVTPGDEVLVSGKYTPCHESSNRRPYAAVRNQLVARFLQGFERQEAETNAEQH